MAEALNRELLSAVELAEYDRQGKLEGVSGILKPILGYGVALALSVAILMAVVNFTRDSGYEAFANWIITPAGVLLLGYWGLAAIGSILEVEKKLKRVAATKQVLYLSKIRYDYRVRAAKAAPPRFTTDDNADYRYTWLTGSYDPARFYSYSKDQRDYMKMTGMDADTYDSNM